MILQGWCQPLPPPGRSSESHATAFQAIPESESAYGAIQTNLTSGIVLSLLENSEFPIFSCISLSRIRRYIDGRFRVLKDLDKPAVLPIKKRTVQSAFYRRYNSQPIRRYLSQLTTWPGPITSSTSLMSKNMNVERH